MGITGLSAFLKKKCPDAFVRYRLDLFKGKRVAVDAFNVMFRYMSVAQGKVINITNLATEELDRKAVQAQWLDLIFDFIETWLQYGVTPVFIFDGDSPEEKEATKAKRRETKDKIKGKIAEEREKMLDDDPLTRNPAEYTKWLKQHTMIRAEDGRVLRTALNLSGIPVIQANCDAEKLCVAMVTNGLAAASFSNDTDNFALGCPLTIREFSGVEWIEGQRVHTCMCVDLDTVLSSLEMTMDQFRTLCVVCGCDYNDSVPRVGPVTAYKRVMASGLESFNEEQLSMLNVGTCKRLLTPRSVLEHMENPDHIDNIDLKPISMDAREFLETFGLGARVDYMLRLRGTTVG